MKKTAVITVVVASLGFAIYEAHRAATLEFELHELQGKNAALASQVTEGKSDEGDRKDRVKGAESLGAPSVNSELLRLRAEVGVLRQQIAAATAKPQPSTNHISFQEPYLSRDAWFDHGTDKPLNTILTMFWALRESDESKVEQIASRVRDSQTLDQLIYPKNQWDTISAIQVVKVGWSRAVIAGTAQDLATAEVIVEKAPPVEGAYKDVSTERWSLKKVDEQWLITGWH